MSGIGHLWEQLHLGDVARIQVDVTLSLRNQSPSSRRTDGEKSQMADCGWVIPQRPNVTEKKSVGGHASRVRGRASATPNAWGSASVWARTDDVSHLHDRQLLGRLGARGVRLRLAQ